MSDFAILPHIIPCVVYENLTKHKTEDIFLYMAIVAYHILKEAKRLFGNSPLRINTQLLANRINKMVEINALDLVI